MGLFDSMLSEWQLYRLNIHFPEQCPYPQTLDGCCMQILIPYKKNPFKVNDFINYLFNLIDSQKGSMQYGMYKKLVDMKSDEIEFVMSGGMTSTDNNKSHHLYAGDDLWKPNIPGIHQHSDQYIKLFMILLDSNQANTRKLKI